MKAYRYPIAPIVATLLKIAAVLALLFFAYQFINIIKEISQSWAMVKGNPQVISQVISSMAQSLLMLLLAPAAIWAIGDGLLALRDIEFNTRGGVAEAPAVTTTTAPVVTKTEKTETTEDHAE
ncbi:MAG: hypothetical protein ACYDBB_01690 [Armatimonadota bacterium]